MCICIQFNLRAVYFKLQQIEPPFHKDIVLLFWIFDDIPSMIHNLKWYERIADIAVTWNKNIFCLLFTD